MKTRPKHWTSRDFKAAEIWDTLQKGDVVDLVAPGSACSPEDLIKGAEFVKSLGLVPRYPKDIFSGKTPATP